MIIKTLKRHRAALVVVAVAPTFTLSACGDDTWTGAVLGEEDSVQVGEYEGSPSGLSVKCSGDPESSVTAEITAPGGFVATSTQPEGGGVASVTVKGPDLEVTWNEHGVASTVPEQEDDSEDAATWGKGPTLTSGELDEYPLETDRDYYRFNLGDATVNCTKVEDD